MQSPSTAPTALVSIHGGVMSREIVQAELAHRIRPDWKWEAVPHGDNSFLVAFPSFEELKRMDDVEFRLKNHGVSMTIIEWKTPDDVIPAYELDEVWIHVSGVPAPWHHYLAFWALGCVIGATQEVDMLTYRRTGVIRMKVFMHSSVVLPITTDVVFGKLGYPITYALENESFRPAKIMEVDQMDHDGDTQEDQDDSSRDGHHDQVHKKARNSENTTPPKEQSSDVTAMQLALTPLVNCQPLPPPRPVIADEKEVMTARSTPRIMTHTCSYKPDGIPSAPEQLRTQTTGSEHLPLLTPRSAAATRTTAVLSPVAQEEVLHEGKINTSSPVPQLTRASGSKAGSSTPRRRSMRSNVENLDGIARGDDDSLLKAMKRTAVRNLDDSFAAREVTAPTNQLHSASRIASFQQGTATRPSQSLPSLPHVNVASNLKSLGVSLGTSNVSFLLNVLKHIEVDRTKVATKPRENNQSISFVSEVDPFMTSDDEGDDIDGALLAHLVKDISEIDMEDVDQSNKICDLLVSTRKSKSSSKRKERKSHPKNPKITKIVSS